MSLNNFFKLHLLHKWLSFHYHQPFFSTVLIAVQFSPFHLQPLSSEVDSLLFLLNVLLIFIPSKCVVDLPLFPNPSTPSHTVAPNTLLLTRKSIICLSSLFLFISSFLLILIVKQSIF